jgi:hypothetical protein
MEEIKLNETKKIEDGTFISCKMCNGDNRSWCDICAMWDKEKNHSKCNGYPCRKFNRSDKNEVYFPKATEEEIANYKSKVDDFNADLAKKCPMFGDGEELGDYGMCYEKNGINCDQQCNFLASDDKSSCLFKSGVEFGYSLNIKDDLSPEITSEFFPVNSKLKNKK